MLRISMHYPRCSVSLRFFSGHFSGLTAWVQPNSDKFHVITSKMSIVAYGIHTSVSILRLNYDDNLLPNKLAPWNKKRKKSMLLSRKHQHQHDNQEISTCQALAFQPRSCTTVASERMSTPQLPDMYGVLLTNSYFRAASYLKLFSRKSWMVADLAKVMMVTFGKPLTSLSLSLDHLFANVPQNIKVWAGKEMLCTIWACSMSVRHVLKQSWRGDTKVLAKFEFLSTQNHHGGQFFWQGMWVHVFESSGFRCLNLWWICCNHDQHSLNEKTARGASGLSVCLYPN